MKKYFFIALAALSLASCEEETSLNTPAFEVFNGYDHWKATKMQATVDNGNLVIVGANDTENITLYIGDYEFGREYPLGETNEHIVTYAVLKDEVTYFYSTSSSTGKGYIKLDPVEKQVPGTITGTFFAEMVPVIGTPTLPGQSVVNLNRGVFFQIPLKEAVVVSPVEETPEETPQP